MRNFISIDEIEQANRFRLIGCKVMNIKQTPDYKIMYQLVWDDLGNKWITLRLHKLSDGETTCIHEVLNVNLEEFWKADFGKLAEQANQECISRY